MEQPSKKPKNAMIFANKENIRRFGTLSLLYFVQGAPYGFQVGCLPLILRKAGLSFSQLGAMKLLFIPWVCKPLYAPIVERTRSRLWWLITSMLVLGSTCVGAVFSSPDGILAMFGILFLLNLASATQDVSVDSLALSILNPKELGAGNTVQVVAYKAGSVFAGGALLWLNEHTSWSAMWIAFGSIYFICIFLVIFLNLVKSDEDKKHSNNSETEKNSLWTLLSENLSYIFKVKGTWWMVTFVLFYKLCERGESVFPIYLIDKGVSMSKMAFWNGFVRAAASVCGSGFSGYLLSSRSVKVTDVLLKFAKLRCIPIFAQLVIIHMWGYEPMHSEESLSEMSSDSILFYSSVVSLCLANFVAGVLTTAAFTAMMTISQSAPENIRSTHYSFLATMEVLGKLAFATVSGALIDMFGLTTMYLTFVATALLTVPLLWVRPEKPSK